MISSVEKLKNKLWKYLPEFVYGSIDGTVTTFAIIAGIAGAKLDPQIVLILGFSNVLADGFSMASSNYLSEQSHQSQHAGGVHTAPWKMALVTLISFIVVGSIPMLTYVWSYIYPGSVQNEFYTASVLTFITFLIIGLIRGKIAEVSMIKTALQTCAIGVTAAMVAYGVGAWLQSIV